jgi:hypothetical protein
MVDEDSHQDGLTGSCLTADEREPSMAFPSRLEEVAQLTEQLLPLD